MLLTLCIIDVKFFGSLSIRWIVIEHSSLLLSDHELINIKRAERRHGMTKPTPLIDVYPARSLKDDRTLISGDITFRSCNS